MTRKPAQTLVKPADLTTDQWVAMLKRDLDVYTAAVAWARKTKQRRPFAFQGVRDITATLNAMEDTTPSSKYVASPFSYDRN